MRWDVNALFLLSSILIQSVFIPITLIYYFKVIRPNKDKLFWKIRRPNYFLFYIIITLLNDVIRCTSGLLFETQVINQYWYSLSSVPLAYFGGITWGSIRLWLLYYDIKTTRNGQYFLLSTHLTASASSLIDINTAQSYVLQKRYISVTWRVFAAVIIFCTITLVLDISFGLVSISKLLMYSFILLLLFGFTYFICRLCCCTCCCKRKIERDSLETSPFRDDWSLLLELTIIWFIWMIGLFGAFFLLPFRGQPIYPVLIAYLTMITRVIITLTMLILPYKVSQRSKETRDKKVSISVLKSVLSTKSYFYAFLEHLVHEMAIENLTALVEIWQFKYEHKYHLEPMKVSTQNLINIKIEPTKQNTPTTECEWYKSSFTPTISYESAYNLDIANNPVDQNVNQQELDSMVEFLKSMPWNRLPLAQSIALNLSQTGANMAKI